MNCAALNLQLRASRKGLRVQAEGQTFGVLVASVGRVVVLRLQVPLLLARSGFQILAKR